MSENAGEMRLMNEAETASFLSVKPGTLAGWRWKKIGPPYLKISENCIRYVYADLIKWLQTKAELKAEAA